MKVIVDHTLCEGHGRCMETVDTVFEVREDDRSYPLMEDVPEELRAKVEHAVAVCPRAAIRIEN